MDAARQHDLAQLLIGLRRAGRAQSGLDPDLIPPDPASAYQVAATVAADLGWPVVGWKIAAAKPAAQQNLGSDSPVYGRVFAPFVHTSPATVEHAELASPMPEIEYQVRLGADLPPRVQPYSVDEVTDAVASMHIGFELAECRFVRDDAYPPLPAFLADGAGSGRLVTGPEIEDWPNRDIPGQEVTLSINGSPSRQGTAAAALDHPIVPLTWLANELSRAGLGLAAGQWVTTGTLTGVVPPKPGDTYVGDFGQFGSVTLTFT